MKLYILRHGDAVEHGDSRYSEDERPLTSKGTQRTKFLAHALREMEIEFDTILSSPLARARQTAEIVAHGLRHEKAPQLTDHLAPSGSLEKLIGQIHGLHPAPAAVLLVGHEPYLSGLISLLCTGGPGLGLSLKKGAFCRLEVDALSCGQCAALEWLLPPRVIDLKPSKRE